MTLHVILDEAPMQYKGSSWLKNIIQKDMAMPHE